MKKGKMLIKWCLVIMLGSVLLLMITVQHVDAARKLTDINKGSYYYDAVMELTEATIINGYPDGRFGPHDKLTREQAMILFKRALELEVPANYKEIAGLFKDVGQAHHYAEYVAAVYQKGIFSGYNNKMGMKNHLSREEMASVLVRAFDLSKKGTANALVGVKDTDKMSVYHKADIEILYDLKLTSGLGNGLYGPKNDITRADFTVFLHRLLTEYGGGITDTQLPTDTETTTAIELEVIRLTNLEREKVGLPAFKTDDRLIEAARAKSEDMYHLNYFAHHSPTYGNVGNQLDKAGIYWRGWGENIAKGYPTAEAVVKGWMNSPGHRANILKPEFTHIGVGLSQKDRIWTQQFIYTE